MKIQCAPICVVRTVATEEADEVDEVVALVATDDNDGRAGYVEGALDGEADPGPAPP